MPKYSDDRPGILNDESYFDILRGKGVKELRIRRTQDFSKLKGIDVEIEGEHLWSYGDSLYKLSYKYYNSYDFWWTIGLVNNKPTDAHYSIGDVVLIPVNPGVISEAMR